MVGKVLYMQWRVKNKMAPPLYGIFTTPNLIGCVIIIFVIAILHRQLNNFGAPFNKWIAYIMLLPYFLVDKYFALKWAIAVGLLGGIIVGFVGGMFMGADDGDTG